MSMYMHRECKGEKCPNVVVSNMSAFVYQGSDGVVLPVSAAE